MTKERVCVAFVGMTDPPSTFLRRLATNLALGDVEVMVPESIHRHFSGTEVKGYWQCGWNEGAMTARLAGLARAGIMYLRLEERKRVTVKEVVSMAATVREKLHAFLQSVSLMALGREAILYFPWNSSAAMFLPVMRVNACVVSCRGAHVNIAPHNPRRYALRDALPDTFRRAIAVHCVSEAILNEAALYGLDRRKGVVIRPAVDTRSLRPVERTRTADQFNVISTGSVIWRKGYDYALSAVANLKAKNVPVRFHVIGSGGDMDRMKHTVEDLKLQESVVLHGRQDEDGVGNLLGEADVFLLSSLSEGISNAVLEGMARGLPVVTSDCGGMREAVSDGIEGFVVPLRDVEAITDALFQLWSQPELRRSQGERARQRAVAEFDLRQQAAGFRNLFQEVAEESCDTGLEPSEVDLPESEFAINDRQMRGGYGVLSCSPLTWQQGFEYGIEAFQGVSDMSYRIVGDGPYWEALHFARHQMDLRERVEFLGQCGRSQLGDLLMWADVYLDCSVVEGDVASDVALDAATKGVPVITTSQVLHDRMKKNFPMVYLVEKLQANSSITGTMAALS